MRLLRPLIVTGLCVCLCAVMLRCASSPSKLSTQPAAPSGATARGSAKVQGVNLNDPIRPEATNDAVVFGAAKNEWASFAVQVSALPKPNSRKPVAYTLRIQAPRSGSSNDTIPVDSFSAEQILPMPVDVNRAGFVRHTGLSAASRPLPWLIARRSLMRWSCICGETRATIPRSSSPNRPSPVTSTLPGWGSA